MASADLPIIIDDDDSDMYSDYDDGLELLAFETVPSGDEIITIEEDERATRAKTPKDNHEALGIHLPDVEEVSYKLPDGVTVVPGSTIELKDRAKHGSGKLHSGDFLRVRHIIRNLETDQVRLRGFRLRRAKYLGPMLSWKMNELVLILHVDEHEEGSVFVRGMVDIVATEILRARDCILTNKSYPALSFREHGSPSKHVGTVEEARSLIFHQARLICRKVNILFLSKNGKAYSGEVRQLYSDEADPQHRVSASLLRRGASEETSIPIHDSEEDEEHFLDMENLKRSRRSIPSKPKIYSFADCFCGAGGASVGAADAGLTVFWGLDHDRTAINAYSQNHPGALPYCGDAHDFPPRGADLNQLHVDVLHLSPPCCFWSPAHTRDGQNDQANYEAIYTVGPILSKVQPRVATLEQTYGLATYEDHKNNFLLLMHDILRVGYNLRYKLVNMTDFGVPQQRIRLLMVTARIGEPLPPFPGPTHGEPGSGLAHFVSITDALVPLERLGDRALGDPYHQPKSMKVEKPPYDPQTSLLKGCITTGGGDNYHYSGTRKFTPRELSLLQTFPMGYEFFGSKGDAKRQIGNAFPPAMAALVFKAVAKTLEAFDNDLIDAEDDISNIDTFLYDKGIDLPKKTSDFGPPYRYLVRERNFRPHRLRNAAGSSSIFRRTVIITPRPREHLTRPPLSCDFHERRRVLADARIAEEEGEIIELD